MLTLLLNPTMISLAALVLALGWALMDEKDKSRSLLVIGLVINLGYGGTLSYVMGKENGLVPWKYDHVLACLDGAMGLNAASWALFLRPAHLPLFVIYQLMVPMMIVWLVVLRRTRSSASLVLAYVAELVTGPVLYAVVPACGPLYAFRANWLHPPAVEAATIRMSGMPNAFPSLHVATAFILMLFAPSRTPRVISAVFLATTIMGTISTGEHYIIDLVAGLAFGAFAAALGRRRIRQCLLFAGISLTWSLAVRFDSGFFLAHPTILRVFALATIAACAAAVVQAWRRQERREPVPEPESVLTFAS